MKIIDTSIEGVKVIEPKVFGDERGYFFESWQKEKFAKAGITNDFIQDNESFSTYGVLRGLHYQLPPYTQAKLVRVIQGRVLDVAVDICLGSPTFGKHISVELSDENKRQFYLPRGMAHGFVVLSEKAIFVYKCDNAYAPTHEASIRFDDPSLGIDWRIPKENLKLSPKDLAAPLLKEAKVCEKY